MGRSSRAVMSSCLVQAAAMVLLATMLGGCGDNSETIEHCSRQETAATCTASEAESGHSCYW
eukprot:5480049-Pyramimonas_sp.AAC.1